MAWGASLLLHFLLCLSICSLVPQKGLCEQTYMGGPAEDAPKGCTREVDASPGYTSNGLFGAFITFRAGGPYPTLRSISSLFKTEASLMVNGGNTNITEATALQLNQLVVVQGDCTSSPGSSTSSYYRMKVPSYIAQTGDSVYSIANQVYQGLTTCQAIFDHNPTIVNHQAPENITTGTDMVVPVRCACPTETQTEAGIKSLLTYIVADGDTVVDVSSRFKVDPGLTFKANRLSKHDQIYPFTTLLLPILQTRPSMSAALQPPSPRHDQYVTPSPSKAKKSKAGVIALRYLFIFLGVAAGLGLAITFKINHCTCIQINHLPP